MRSDFNAEMSDDTNKPTIPCSELTCPECGKKSVEAMPTDACAYFYECQHCRAILNPKKGDCCVFCSYGSVPCPPVQAQRRDGTQSSCC